VIAGSQVFSLATGQQAIATVNGNPVASVVTPILAANSNIASAFAVHPSYFGIGEEGGEYTASGSGSQTITDTVNLTVDLTQLGTRQDLELGLFSGTAIGSGVSSLTFTVIGDGNTLVNQTFSGATATSDAVAFFTNHAIDLGSLASGPLSGNTLTLTLATSITVVASGEGFDAGFLIGDPPEAGAASVHHMASALASFGGEMGIVSSQRPAFSSYGQASPLTAPTAHFA
jgi:hypothetical protein